MVDQNQNYEIWPTSRTPTPRSQKMQMILEKTLNIFDIRNVFLRHFDHQGLQQPGLWDALSSAAATIGLLRNRIIESSVASAMGSMQTQVFWIFSLSPFIHCLRKGLSCLRKGLSAKTGQGLAANEKGFQSIYIKCSNLSMTP